MLHAGPWQVSKEEAAARIKAIGEPYKQEILDSILAKDPNAPITIYHIGETEHPQHWWDLCAGPHVGATADINLEAFNLESVAGEQPCSASPAPLDRDLCSQGIAKLTMVRETRQFCI